jgi:hypothetical protein
VIRSIDNFDVRIDENYCLENCCIVVKRRADIFVRRQYLHPIKRINQKTGKDRL